MGDEDESVTEDDLKAAQERWADLQHEPVVKDIFSRPVYGDGFRGDVPVEREAEKPTENKS